MSGESGTLTPATRRAPGTSRRVSTALSAEVAACISTSMVLVIDLHSSPPVRRATATLDAAVAPWCASRDLPLALLEEREQVAIDDVGVRGGEAVRQARVVDFHGALDQLC